MRSFPFYIARRYLFSKKSHNAINVISAISVVGVSVATMALVVTLSVFNGFHDLVASFFTAFDPELSVTPAVGKTVAATDSALLRVKGLDVVESCSETLEDNALVMYGYRQAVVTIKGVDDNFSQLTHIEDILYGDGVFELHADVLAYGTLGIALAEQLGTGARFPGALDVYAPVREGQIDMTDPSQGFVHDELFSNGVVFSVKQTKYDKNYIIAPLSYTQNLFGKQGQVSALELKLKPGVSIGQAKAQIRAVTGSRFVVRDRYEQQEDVFKIMKIEKLMAYVFLTFILIVACFNIIGSLSMLIIDKRDDVQTLRNLGATDRQVVQVFLFEGRMISLLGAVLGISIGLLLCWIQIRFGVVSLGKSSGSFVVDAYPVSVYATDVLLIFVTVIAAGFLSVWYPVRYLSRRLLEVGE